MRVLLGHAYYREPGGEDAVFRHEKKLLEDHGVEVVPLERHNTAIRESGFLSRITLAQSTAWSNSAYQMVAKLIDQHRPSVAHFHNTFPVLSPSVYAACTDKGVPVVQTLHNFRLICPGAMLFRNGRPCEDCIGRLPFPAVRYRCYRDSASATAAISWMIMRNRLAGTFRRRVTRYIALTHFAASRFVAGGLPENRITVKPNFLADPPPPGQGLGGYAVYVGRLSREKGIETLLSAWDRIKNVGLKIIGDGPMRAELEERARQMRVRVEFLGHRPRSEIFRIVGDAAFQIVPSRQYEGFPLVVLEAYACGTPVVASKIGSLDEIVREGVTGTKFVSGDPLDLAERIDALRADGARLRAMRASTRAEFDGRYGAEENFKLLMQIYADVLRESGRTGLAAGDKRQ